MKGAVLAVALTVLCVTDAFTQGPAAALSSARSATKPSTSTLKMAGTIPEEDFIPSETWYMNYLGQNGLRYGMAKSPQEIEQEGDFSLWDKIWGGTSNNAAKMALKKQVRAMNKPKDKELYDTWLQKYGWGRWLPSYVDKSGEQELPAPIAPPPAEIAKGIKAAASAITKSAPSKPAAAPAKSFFQAASKAATSAAKSVSKAASSAVKDAPKPVSKPAPKPASKPASSRPSVLKAPARAVASAAKPAQSAVKATASAVKSAPAAVAKAAPRLSAPPAARGDLGRIPKKA